MATLRELLAGIPQKLLGTPQQDEALPTQVIEYSPKTQEYMNAENMPTQLSLGTKTTPATNGFLQDFMAGAKENYNNAFKPENLQPQNKNWATRLGEGVGTALRFGDSSAGRGLMAGAAALALGMSPGQALGYGLGTTAGRQKILATDTLYRNKLKEMGATEEDLNKIKGYIDNDMFKNLSLADYRNSMVNYRNTKLDKDTYLKAQQNIYKMLNDGVITAEEATRQILLLNNEFDRQNTIEFQEGLKKTQGDKKLEIQGQNANTYAGNSKKPPKPEETEEYKQDLADYIQLTNDPKRAKLVPQFEAQFALKYGKLPPKVR